MASLPGHRVCERRKDSQRRGYKGGHEEETPRVYRPRGTQAVVTAALKILDRNAGLGRLRRYRPPIMIMMMIMVVVSANGTPKPGIAPLTHRVRRNVALWLTIFVVVSYKQRWW